MDHPVTTVPMSSQIIDQIKGWNTDQIEADLKEQGLVGDESEFQEAAEKLRNLESKPSEIQEQTFKQIQPKAMKRMSERITALQDYIQECESAGTEPTMRGAFDKMYPDIAPFMKVCRRMDFNPSASIGINGGAQRSLQSIIDDAKKYNLASDDEVQEMNQALENLRQSASSIQEAQTAIIT